MRFTNTSATTFADLLIAVRNHLSANGWTILVDDTGLGTPALQVTNSVGDNFLLTTSTTARTDAVSGAFTDHNLLISYDAANFGGASGYAPAVSTNDMAAPFANVWIISDDAATFCHLICQVSVSRYSHASFGNLNNRGIHTSEVSYVVGNFWEWWRNNVSPTESITSLNNPSDPDHARGFAFEAGRYRLGLPDGLLDPALSFTDGPIDGATARDLCIFYYTGVVNGNTQTRLLDYFGHINNQGHTGGVNIAPLPCCVFDSDFTNAAYIGDLPSVGMVNIVGLSPGQVLTFGAEEWIVFPLKQAGTFNASKAGGNPANVPNSVMYGMAYRKA